MTRGSGWLSPAHVGAVCVLAVVGSGASSPHPWPMLMGDVANLGKSHEPGSVALPAAKPKLLWKYEAAEEVESSAVISADGLVLAAAGGTVFAVDKSSGKLRWKFPAEVLATGALGGSAFFIGSDDHHFYALDRQTGKLLWKFRAGEFTGGATVSEETQTVYAGSGAKKLHAYYFNGTRRFEFSAAANVCSTPALDGSNVYFGDDSGFFYCIDAETGKQNWKVKFPSNIRSPARLGKEGIFIGIGDPDGTKSGEIVRLDYDGSIRWRSDCDGKQHKCESCWTAPAVVGDVVVAGCGLDSIESGKIWGLDLNTGKVRWSVKADNDCQTSSPVARGGSVLLGCTDGKLYAIEAASGFVQWTFAAKKGIWATPAIDQDGTIFIGSHDGFLYALVDGHPVNEEL